MTANIAAFVPSDDPATLVVRDQVAAPGPGPSEILLAVEAKQPQPRPAPIGALAAAGPTPHAKVGTTAHS